MADDMDIDMDIDLNLGPEEYMQDETIGTANEHDTGLHTTTIDLPQDPITSEPHEPEPAKVHIRGLDNLSSSDVKRFASEHFSLDEFVRIEWVDDTSANLLYNTEDAAQDALAALTDMSAIDIAAFNMPPRQLRPAKPLSSHPNSRLYVRQATTIDVKKKGAHEASRYYLMNPDQDPRERKRLDEPNRRRRGSDVGDYNRRRFDDREHKRRREERGGFDASMYDDDTGEGSTADERRKRARRGDDLFADHMRFSSGRLRNRSASPTFDGDGRMGFGTDDEVFARDRRRTARLRSRSPFRERADRNAGRELFPSATVQGTALSNSNPSKELFPEKVSTPKELFPEKLPSTPAPRELFPNKRQSFSNHRRTDAFDASRSDAGEFFASSATPPPPRERSLAERATTGRPATADAHEFRIRGAEKQGMSIRGSAAQANATKELFPLKAGNTGKELFGDNLKIKGRGGPRRKAEDMFF